MTAAELTERRFQAQVLEIARMRRWLTYHVYDSRRSQRGFPDLVLCREGRVIFAELKSERGRLRPEQKAWLEELALATVESYVWRPSDIQTIAEVLA